MRSERIKRAVREGSCCCFIERLGAISGFNYGPRQSAGHPGSSPGQETIEAQRGLWKAIPLHPA
ncbi:MAG: hypothetical protein ACREP9_03085, partial [Candidatus Dormibacteraceae bacterium]